MSADPFDLSRFVLAQTPVYDRVLAELIAGEKRSHWMWFVFPQLHGLGHSSMALRYGIASLDEAAAYLKHPVLGPRLSECAGLVLRHQGRPLWAIFGSPDDLKFRSCMTLFAKAGPGDGSLFRQALDLFCSGEADPRTLAILAQAPA